MTWGIGGIALMLGLWRPELRPLSTSSPLYYVAGYSVSLAGIALTAQYGGRAGMRQLGVRLLPWRSSARWYAIVLVGYAAITGIALLAGALAHSTAVALPQWRSWPTALILAILKDPGPVGEEFGWRGFALPRLLERYSPLHASVRLGLMHAAWHLPLFFIPGMPQTQVSFPLFALGVVAIAIFNTALYVRTGGSLLVAILVHLLANVGGGFALDAKSLNIFFATEGLAAALIVLAGGLRSTEPRPFTTPNQPIAEARADGAAR
jgi:hypothetical protein